MNRMNVLKSAKIKSVLGDVVWYGSVVVVGCMLAHITPPSNNAVALTRPFTQGEVMPRNTTAQQDIEEINSKVQMHK
ncbi:hypothetical protein HNP12_000224 [Aeromonas hydrophila]|uniref:hypothetical protein n=1 Tax=Aeromonas TaxID=642 RepID=UPI002169D0DC|nr:hypothetical protein [Aeromonas hydrophila]MCS3766185.1 hypothetical protein [Aeromonas hydrophila]